MLPYGIPLFTEDFDDNEPLTLILRFRLLRKTWQVWSCDITNAALLRHTEGICIIMFIRDSLVHCY